jgi:hypothetical protein
MDIEGIVIAHRGPLQSPFVERLFRSIGCEFLGRVTALSEQAFKLIPTSHSRHHHARRIDHSSEMDALAERTIQRWDPGQSVEIVEVGGLHTHCQRRTH